LEKLKIDEKINDVLHRVLEYEQQKVGHLSICDRDKIVFIFRYFYFLEMLAIRWIKGFLLVMLVNKRGKQILEELYRV